MIHSFITRLLQVSPAVAGAVFLASAVIGGQGGRGGHVGREDGLAAIPALALVRGIPSHDGRYVASLAPVGEGAWNGSEGWTISLRDANGEPVDGAALEIEAWQPDVVAAASQVAGAKALGAGEYRVDGVALDASGWWNVKLAVAGATADSLAFNVILR